APRAAPLRRALGGGFAPERLWPLAPVDYEPETAEVVRGIYIGAAGMLHGLDRLAEFSEPRLDAGAILEGLELEPDEDGRGRVAACRDERLPAGRAPL